MTVTQSQVQVSKNLQNLTYQCKYKGFVDGVPFEVRWNVDAMALELVDKDALKNTIAIMIRGNLDHNKISHSKNDLHTIVNKMVNEMYKYIPVLAKKAQPYSKPVAVPEGWGPDKTTQGGVGKINGKPVSQLAELLPGMKVNVDYPCECIINTQAALESVIIHLNDQHGTLPKTAKNYWDREKIAKWLDEIHDSGIVNLEFQPWDSEGKEENGN